MANGPFRQMMDGAIVLNNQPAITGPAEQPLFPTANYAGWPANVLRSGQKWILTAYGNASTPAAAPGNITITPRFGLGTTGTPLGASPAAALSPSAAGVLWRLEAVLTVRGVGNPGLNSPVMCNGVLIANPALLAVPILFGGVQTLVDLSQPAGFYIGVAMGNAADQIITTEVVVESFN
jgi:hypothetical protein